MTCKEGKSTPMITSACATALAGLNSTKQSSSGSVNLQGAHFRGWNKYAGTYPAKMSTVVLIFADGAQIRVRICAPGACFRGGTNTLLHRRQGDRVAGAALRFIELIHERVYSSATQKDFFHSFLRSNDQTKTGGHLLSFRLRSLRLRKIVLKPKKKKAMQVLVPPQCRLPVSEFFQSEKQRSFDDQRHRSDDLLSANRKSIVMQS